MHVAMNAMRMMVKNGFDLRKSPTLLMDSLKRCHNVLSFDICVSNLLRSARCAAPPLDASYDYGVLRQDCQCDAGCAHDA
jgi:hypothetical protein